ncbi:hypothetical protein AgCh_006535 [Apium graveolens]
MLKHIKKRPSKSDTMRNLLEDMVAEVKRLRDHQNIEIKNEISNLKQQEEKRKSCLSSVKECLLHAKCKLMQIKESSDSRNQRKEARPWLDPFKNIDKVKKAMDKMEVDIEDLESNQRSTTNYLIGLEGFFLSTKSRQQQMEIYMDKTLRIFGFDEEVKKKPRAMKPRHDKLTRRCKPVSVESSVQSTCRQYTFVTYQPETSTELSSNDLAWARELERDMNVESGEHGLAIHHFNEQDEKKHPETILEKSNELNMWARDLEDDLISEAEETHESKTHVLSSNNKFKAHSTETSEHDNKSSITLNHVMGKKSEYLTQQYGMDDKSAYTDMDSTGFGVKRLPLGPLSPSSTHSGL